MTGTQQQQHTRARPIPTWAHVGKLRRLSFLTRDRAGNLVRAWHDGLPGDAQAVASLRGMVHP